jgi:poly-gamma-glutamate synthesis protein (capsule biosynthesis protein)
MKIVFLPDISLFNTSKNKRSFKKLNTFLNHLKERFEGSNFIINLESILTSKNLVPIKKNNFNLYSLGSLVNILSDNNIKNVCLSNNHIFDFGYNGFQETINLLKKNKINFFGAGKNYNEAKKPLLFKQHQAKCAIFGMSYKPVADKKKPGIFDLKSPKSIKVIKSFKKKNKSTFIIVYCHTGLELFGYPLKEDEKIFKKLISNGADLIIGSHPHRLQGIEKYKGKFILYSVGDLFSENVKIKDWLRYITKPAHAAFYKSKIKRKIILDSYIVEIDVLSSQINIYKISRSLNFKYSIKKINNEDIEKLSAKYKSDLKKSQINDYRTLIEGKIFKDVWKSKKT